MRKWGRAAVLFGALLLAIPVAAGARTLEMDIDAGDDIARVQMRLQELDYFNYRPTGTFAGMTRTAVQKFQEYNSMAINGKLTEEQQLQLFSKSAVRCPIPADVKIPIGPAAKGKFGEFGEAADWFDVVDSKLHLQFEYQVTDLNTGTKFYVKRVGGKNHAHFQPSNASDKASYNKTVGSAPNWNKRPILVDVYGVKYAASMQSFLHEGQGDEEYFCAFFKNSLSDILSLPDPEHAANVAKAAGEQ